MKEPQQITSCADRSCPSRERCKRYVSMIRGFGVPTAYADFNRAEGAEKCADGFEQK